MESNQKTILSRIISLMKSSEIKYKENNFRGSLEDKLKIKSLINEKLISNKEIMDKYMDELSKLYSSKFDLIKDHRMKISDKKRMQIINLLEKKSQEKLLNCDYEGAVKALRRSEKYQYKIR
tara:strand:+ start:1003 stop:1368 length:366 start_codon:yes stop_codon:yes gene_type:complete